MLVVFWFCVIFFRCCCSACVLAPSLFLSLSVSLSIVFPLLFLALLFVSNSIISFSNSPVLNFVMLCQCHKVCDYHVRFWEFWQCKIELKFLFVACNHRNSQYAFIRVSVFLLSFFHLFIFFLFLNFSLSNYKKKNLVKPQNNDK